MHLPLVSIWVHRYAQHHGGRYLCLCAKAAVLPLWQVSREDLLGKQVTRDYGAPAQILTEVLPRPMAFCVVLLLLVLMQFQDIAQLLASSRFIWALARDSAIPFSPWLSRLSTSRIPLRATWVVCAIAGPALLLIAVSRKIVTSLVLQGCGSSLVLAYLMPVICYLTCSSGALDADGRNEWTLRGWSKPFAVLGSTYVLLIIVLMLCPNTAPVSASKSTFVTEWTRLTCGFSVFLIRWTDHRLCPAHGYHDLGLLWQFSLRWTDQINHSVHNRSGGRASDSKLLSKHQQANAKCEHANTVRAE